jgi:hypothetical protein
MDDMSPAMSCHGYVAPACGLQAYPPLWVQSLVAWSVRPVSSPWPLAGGVRWI